MRLSARTLSVALALLWTGVLLRASVADEPKDEPKDRMTPGHCGCSEGKACWHYLRTPLRPPEDPCRCGFCAVKGDCSSKDRPDGWSGLCMGSQKLPCFWKRHAASWSITCAACHADKECPACDEVAQLPDPEKTKTLLAQAQLEGDSPKHKVLVAWSPHFYIATDLAQLKLVTQGGQPRVADQHEVAHLFLERAEKAYDDFVKGFGDDVRLDRPMGIFLAARKAKKEAWQSAYFGSASTNMIYGGGTSKVSRGFCFNGFALSADEDGDDHGLHAHVRHMIGHLLFSCWHGVAPFQKECPKWAFCGVADWLCKSDPAFFHDTVFCHDEGGGPNGSGKDWDKKARIVAANRHTQIEKLFGIPSLSHMEYDDLVRCWSYFDVMMKEDRERWLATLKGIREGKEHAVAFKEGMGMTPDDFDRRWVERMNGRRRTMAEVPKDATAYDDDGPNSSERRRIRGEQDLEVLAALLRGVHKVGDPKTLDAVLSRLDADSDLIRETIALILARTEDSAVVARLREVGLVHPDPMARAYVARALGEIKDAGARVPLEGMLDDAHWLVRANSARALSQIGDPASIPVLVARVEDGNDKAWISKADALGAFGQAATKATIPVTTRLSGADWQVRLTACRVLGKIGNADAVTPLIDRLEQEGGRVRKEIVAALKAVTHDDLGENVASWRDWWKKQKSRGIQKPPDTPVNPEDERYAKPKPPKPDEAAYYGRRIFSQSMLFVLDVSKSMDTRIDVEPEAAAKLGGLPNGARIMIAKQAAIQAIHKLDPRARFNIVFFSTLVKPWKDDLVTAGSMKEAAIAAIQQQPLEDETNIHGALKAAVGLHGRNTASGTLGTIPDTIYFLTDGTPTRGEMTDVETILSWMRDVNRFAKVELHVIAMGSLGVDIEFLQRLATENNGEFIHIPDSK
jgi:hypothetical protein